LQAQLETLHSQLEELEQRTSSRLKRPPPSPAAATTTPAAAAVVVSAPVTGAERIDAPAAASGESASPASPPATPPLSAAPTPSEPVASAPLETPAPTPAPDPEEIISSIVAAAAVDAAAAIAHAPSSSPASAGADKAIASVASAPLDVYAVLHDVPPPAAISTPGVDVPVSGAPAAVQESHGPSAPESTSAGSPAARNDVPLAAVPSPEVADLPSVNLADGTDEQAAVDEGGADASSPALASEPQTTTRVDISAPGSVAVLAAGASGADGSSLPRNSDSSTPVLTPRPPARPKRAVAGSSVSTPSQGDATQ
jgi:hypothetical protein